MQQEVLRRETVPSLVAGLPQLSAAAYSSVRMEGGDVWNSERQYTKHCDPGIVGGGSCTTPAWDGSCPIGTTPNGFGMCCFSGGEHLQHRTGKSLLQIWRRF